jgi:hypothetical protein
LTRQHELLRYLPAFVRESRAQRLHPRRLDADATAAQVAARYQLAPPDSARLVAHVQRFATGNPLFAGELLQALEWSDVLRRDADGWALGEIPTLSVPPLVLQVIEARLRRLSAEARTLLEAAAVIVGAVVSMVTASPADAAPTLPAVSVALAVSVWAPCPSVFEVIDQLPPVAVAVPSTVVPSVS